MRLHVIEALALFAAGVLGAWEWVRDWWRSRTDADVDRHPVAVALRTLATEQHLEELRTAAAIAERLRRREVVAECDFLDIDAMQEWHSGRGQR